MTAIAAILLGGVARSRNQASFDAAVETTQDRILERFAAYQILLRGVRGLFAGQEDVTRQEFHDYVERLELGETYPGVQGIGFSMRIDARQMDSVSRAMRRSGFRDFRVWPPSTGPDYHAILYLEPLDLRNRAAIGYNMWTDPARRAAMERARDTGQPAISAKLQLVQEITQDKQSGFVMYAPVYGDPETPPTIEERRSKLIGFVYSPFRADDLFTGIFAREDNPRVTFRVYDGTEALAANELHESQRRGASKTEARRQPLLEQQHIVTVAGRPWLIQYASSRAFEASLDRWLAPAVGALGVVISLLLFGVTRAESRARFEAEESKAIRARFFAAMSHELRTPINAILGYNDLLLAGVYNPLTDEQEESVQRSQIAARHLLELVNDVLDVSKLESGRVTLKSDPVEVPHLLGELVTTIRPTAESNGCKIVTECTGENLVVHTDTRRLSQILLNLLSNAAKFGSGKPITVRCTGGASGVTIEVSDLGPGIPPDQQRQIFEEFVQLPSGVAGGTGLGLPISRRLATLLGGSLTVDSTPGNGSTFRLSLPRTRDNADEVS